MTQELRIIVGGVTRVLAVAAACAAVQPVLADPAVFPVLKNCAIALAEIGVATAGVMAVGYAHHRLQLWASYRPMTIAPSKLYAVEQEHGPEVAGMVAQVYAQEQRTDADDRERQWHNMLTRFVVLGTMYKSFGFEAMCGNVRRRSWDTLKDALIESGVLRIGEGQRPTGFAEGWYCRRVWTSLERGILRPPLPDERHWPSVKWF